MDFFFFTTPTLIKETGNISADALVLGIKLEILILFRKTIHTWIQKNYTCIILLCRKVRETNGKNQTVAMQNQCKR